MFQDVKDKVQLVKDLLAVQAKLSGYIPETTWDTATFGIVNRLLREIVSELNSVIFSEQSVATLREVVQICNNVLNFAVLTHGQKETLFVVKGYAEEEISNQ